MRILWLAVQWQEKVWKGKEHILSSKPYKHAREARQQSDRPKLSVQAIGGRRYKVPTDRSEIQEWAFVRNA
jgi:hypothetical protein